MRFEGTVKTWNEERAFGFIEPEQGGQEIFLHITAFPPRSGRPQLHQRVSFEVELNRDGKKRAKKVQFVQAPRSTKVQVHRGTPAWGGASLFAVPLFVALYLAVAMIWHVPKEVAIGYTALSIVCFIAYAADKSAARSGGWRTKEDTLLIIGLVGGVAWRPASAAVPTAQVCQGVVPRCILGDGSDQRGRVRGAEFAEVWRVERDQVKPIG
jgi:cold shock CspA family protein/uncharacterized membrane protein YsdA (DUF1294 family)